MVMLLRLLLLGVEALGVGQQLDLEEKGIGAGLAVLVCRCEGIEGEGTTWFVRWWRWWWRRVGRHDELASC